MSQQNAGAGPCVGLALGGGAARGFAHIGVIQVLERKGIPLHCVAGTSVGSLVGAALAAGFGAEKLLQMAQEIRWRHILRPVWPRRGIVSFERLEAFLVDALGDLRFSDLALPYAAIAADLATGEQVILRDGRLAPAVRASCSVPGLVTPVEWEGRLLVDGGICNNLPISVVRQLGAQIVIAVGLGAPPSVHPQGLLSTGFAALECMLLHAGDDPAGAEVYIPIPVWGLGSLVPPCASRRESLLALGRQAAENALPAIEATLSGMGPRTQASSSVALGN